MRNGIREFQPRQPLDRQLGATTLNQILRELESLRITRVVNGTFRKLPGGTEITVAPQRGGTPTTRQPWDLIARPNPDSTAVPPDYLVRVQPGTLNGILPSNWDEEFTCAGTGLHYAKAVIATDGVNITSLTIEIDTEEPPLQSALLFSVDNPVTLLFGLFAEGQVYRVIGPGDIIATPELWLTKAKDSPPAVGELPWVNYYRLT
jgi:hypothetical protein